MLHQTQVVLLRALDFLSALLGNTPGSRGRVDEKDGRRSGENSGDHDDFETALQPPPRPENNSQPLGAPLIMVRSSTQQAVDPIVGTAAVIGLSVVFLRWVSNRSSQAAVDTNKCRNKYSWMPWWWPVIAMKRRNNRNAMLDENLQEEEDGAHEHQGSCHCGSINFVLRGPQHLRTVDSPGKIRYPHIPTSADRFQLLRGEENMRFYYEEANDDSSSITFELAHEERDDANDASGAHVFCGNCGVHVFHADRSSGELEVNANCLDGGDKPPPEGMETIITRKRGKAPTPRSHSSLSPTPEGEEANVEETARLTPIETVSEHEPFFGNAGRFLESLDDRDSETLRKESITSDPTTLAETFCSMAEHDDLSMGSSSITGASMPYHSSLSVVSGAVSVHDPIDRTGLPPLGPVSTTSSDRLPPSRAHSSDRSSKTLPAWFGDRPRVGGGWSVASGMESVSDLDGGDAGKSMVSPTTRDQLQRYLSRYKDEKK